MATYKTYKNKIELVSLRKCPFDHWLTYQESVFKRSHSHKHFSEFHLQDGGKNQPA